MNERELTAAVIDLARLLGYRVAHFRAAMTDKGWRTPVSGDGAGFPDCVLVGRGHIIFAELKVGRNMPTRAQEEWGDWIEAAGGEYHVWTDLDWSVGTVEGVLRGEG